MWMRKLLGGGLVAAFLAPLILNAVPGGIHAMARGSSPGMNCCVAMPCCLTGGPCATGGCEKPAAADAAANSAPGRHAEPSSSAPRLAAGCPGPASVVPAVDRDPMLVAAGPSATAPSVPAVAFPRFVGTTSERVDDPTDPPPRA